MDAKQDKWIVVVAPSDPAAAERAFDQWKRDNPWSARLEAADLRIDIIRGLDGRTLRRYCVRERSG